jgi:DNA repair protein RecO (recombination protein O)
VSLYRDEGVVLRTYKLGEADRIVVLMTRDHGKVRAVAKGIRKTKSKIGARLEPMAHVEVLLYRGKDLDVVNQVETIDPAPSLHDDLDRMTQAMAVLEAVDLAAQDREKAPELYAMLVGALRSLAAHPSPMLLAGFYLKMLALEGVGPQVTECVGCGAVDGIVSFDVQRGGVQCAGCRTGLAIDGGVLDLLRDVLGGRLSRALATGESPSTRMVTSLATRLMEQHLERRLRSLSMFGFLGEHRL